MNPWRAYLLLLQDLARRTGTYGGMISSDLHRAKSPQMDAVTPTRGRETPEVCTRKKEGRFPRDTLAGLNPGGILPFHQDVDPLGPMTSSF
jgi:hypothetical protein